MSQTITFRPSQDGAFTPAALGSAAQAFEFRVITSETERHAVYALRARAYAAMGYPLGDDVADASDRFDTLPTTVLIGAFDDGKLVGALRLCFSHPWNTLATLPCAGYYPALKPVKRDATGSLLEVSRLSIEPDIANTSYRTTLYAALVRAGFLAAQAANVSMILVATRPDWVRFYQYMLGFETIGEPALYPPGDFKIALLGGSLAQATLRQRMQNKFFKITLDEIASMRGALSPALARPAGLPNPAIAAGE